MKEIKKILSTGLRLVRMTKNEIEKEINKLVKSRAIKKSDAKTLAKICLKEACTERNKIQNFAINEFKKELAKTKQLGRIMISRGKLALKAHGIELRKMKKK